MAQAAPLSLTSYRDFLGSDLHTSLLQEAFLKPPELGDSFGLLGLLPSSSFCVLPAKLLQLCLTLWDPWTVARCSSSVHGVLQARILEWVAMPFSRGIFPTQEANLPLIMSPALAGGFFITSATSSLYYNSAKTQLSPSGPQAGGLSMTPYTSAQDRPGLHPCTPDCLALAPRGASCLDVDTNLPQGQRRRALRHL